MESVGRPFTITFAIGTVHGCRRRCHQHHHETRMHLSLSSFSFAVAAMPLAFYWIGDFGHGSVGPTSNVFIHSVVIIFKLMADRFLQSSVCLAEHFGWKTDVWHSYTRMCAKRSNEKGQIVCRNDLYTMCNHQFECKFRLSTKWISCPMKRARNPHTNTLHIYRDRTCRTEYLSLQRLASVIVMHIAVFGKRVPYLLYHIHHRRYARNRRYRYPVPCACYPHASV